MRGVDFDHLSALVDFLYLGKANVLQDEIDSFLAIAKELKLKGFSGESAEEAGKDVFQVTTRKLKKEGKEKKVLTSPQMVKQMEDLDQKPPIERAIAEQKPPFEKTIALSSNYDRVDADMDRLDEQINSMIVTTDRSDPKYGKLFACKVFLTFYFFSILNLLLARCVERRVRRLIWFHTSKPNI